MPSGHLAPQDPPQQEQAQTKQCSTCHRPLSMDAATASFILLEDDDTNIVCPPCRAARSLRIDPPLPTTPRGELLFQQVEQELRRRAAALQNGNNEASGDQLPTIVQTLQHHTVSQPRRPDEDIEMHDNAPVAPQPLVRESLLASSHRQTTSPATTISPMPIPSRSRPPLSVIVNSQAPTRTQAPISSHVSHSPIASSSWATPSRPQPQYIPLTYPDPLMDITRLRVRSLGHHCLYPGAIFKGTQKSGRNSYDVNVTIVDVDFASSHLCGYLRIRGLTDDWPELTTYFDAEIIGSRYGFLTRRWGATEQEDMVHWARFPSFRHVRNELKKPHMTMRDADRGAVFMRWKEKFLVPDHRVQDINGASFAGFYYVCVDFNPQHTASIAPSTEDIPEMEATSPDTPKPEYSSRTGRELTSRGSRRSTRSSSRGVTPPAATMSGFYFHQNSEPYQQLSLTHVVEHTSSSFELQ